MKKIIGIGIVSLLMLGTLGMAGMNIGKMTPAGIDSSTGVKNSECLNLTFSEPVSIHNGDYTNVEMNGTETYYMGKFLVPSYSKVMTFPFGTEIEGIDVSIG
ncbi:MAG: hypothetical protein DRN33_04655, partial [Thermoplasmata archaeon]